MTPFRGPDSAAAERGDIERERAPSPPFRALRGHPWIAAAIVLSTLAGSLGWLAVHSPTYRAKAQLLVTPLRSDDPDRLTLPLLQDAPGDPVRTVQTAAALIDSQQAATLTARRLGGDWTPKAVRDAIDVQPQGQTNILDITAEAGSVGEAATLANAFADAVVTTRMQTLRPLVLVAIDSTRAQLARVGQGAARADLQRRLLRLGELRTGRDPTVTISQPAVPSRKATGLPSPLLVALAVLAGGCWRSASYR